MQLDSVDLSALPALWVQAKREKRTVRAQRLQRVSLSVPVLGQGVASE